MFEALLNPQKIINTLKKLTKTVDIKSIFTFFFIELYEKYGEHFDIDIILNMKLLLVINSSEDYFIKKFVPKLIKKIEFMMNLKTLFH